MDKPVDPCDKNATSADACFKCLYSGFKSPSECYINSTAPHTYPIKITLTASNSSVWPSKGTLAVEAALLPFFQVRLLLVKAALFLPFFQVPNGHLVDLSYKFGMGLHTIHKP